MIASVAAPVAPMHIDRARVLTKLRDPQSVHLRVYHILDSMAAEINPHGTSHERKSSPSVALPGLEFRLDIDSAHEIEPLRGSARILVVHRLGERWSTWCGELSAKAGRDQHALGPILHKLPENQNFPEAEGGPVFYENFLVAAIDAYLWLGDAQGPGRLARIFSYQTQRQTEGWGEQPSSTVDVGPIGRFVAPFQGDGHISKGEAVYSILLDDSVGGMLQDRLDISVKHPACALLSKEIEIDVSFVPKAMFAPKSEYPLLRLLGSKEGGGLRVFEGASEFVSDFRLD